MTICPAFEHQPHCRLVHFMLRSIQLYWLADIAAHCRLMHGAYGLLCWVHLLICRYCSSVPLLGKMAFEPVSQTPHVVLQSAAQFLSRIPATTPSLLQVWVMVFLSAGSVLAFKFCFDAAGPQNMGHPAFIHRPIHQLLLQKATTWHVCWSLAVGVCLALINHMTLTCPL